MILTRHMLVKSRQALRLLMGYRDWVCGDDVFSHSWWRLCESSGWAANNDRKSRRKVSEKSGHLCLELSVPSSYLGRWCQHDQIRQTSCRLELNDTIECTWRRSDWVEERGAGRAAPTTTCLPLDLFAEKCRSLILTLYHSSTKSFPSPKRSFL